MDKQNDRLKFVDIPLLCFAGSAIGALFPGILFLIGSIIEADKGCIWSWQWIARSILCVGYSAFMSLMATIYWLLVVRKAGIIKPELTGFGVIIGAISLFVSLVSCVVSFYPSN